jgi:glycyl-tRNA synthetase (class II)
MIYAAEVLTTFGFRPLELMELFGLARRTAYELSKKAKAEIERKMEASERKVKEQERISAASLREDWQDRPGKVETARMKEGYSLREVRSFKQ